MVAGRPVGLKRVIETNLRQEDQLGQVRSYYVIAMPDILNLKVVQMQALP